MRYTVYMYGIQRDRRDDSKMMGVGVTFVRVYQRENLSFFASDERKPPLRTPLSIGRAWYFATYRRPLPPLPFFRACSPYVHMCVLAREPRLLVLGVAWPMSRI